MADQKAKHSKTPFLIEKLANSPAKKTDARRHRTLKISFIPKDRRYLLDEALIELQTDFYKILVKKLISSDWKLPALTGAPYQIRRNPIMFLARDLYMDTKDKRALKHGISYRFSHHFKTPRRLHRHEMAPKNPAFYPDYAEIQATVHRVEEGNGFSHAKESRLEFRKGLPSLFLESAPPPPWLPRDYLPVAYTGIYRSAVIPPARTLARHLKKLGYKDSPNWGLELVLNSTWTEMNIGIKTPDRPGPKQDWTFILSIIRTDVSDGAEYLKFLQRSWYEDNYIPRPQVLGTYFEIDIEFNRVFSSQQAKYISDNSIPLEKSLRQALQDDQMAIMGIVKGRLLQLEAKTVDGDKNKYQTAYQLTRKFRLRHTD